MRRRGFFFFIFLSFHFLSLYAWAMSAGCGCFGGDGGAGEAPPEPTEEEFNGRWRPSTCHSFIRSTLKVLQNCGADALCVRSDVWFVSRDETDQGRLLTQHVFPLNLRLDRGKYYTHFSLVVNGALKTDELRRLELNCGCGVNRQAPPETDDEMDQWTK